jgi:UDP-N-acetyl-D-galactosamine dehydrogenase
MNVDVYDPWINENDVQKEFNISVIKKNEKINLSKYQCIIFAVAHDEFEKLKISKNLNQVIYDVKGVLGKDIIDGGL